jgi:ketosteroid isomerase-like protein
LLMSCWADEDDIVCVHPGGPRLVGAGAIRAAFEMLFAQGALAVRIERVQRVDALASAVHSVIERIEVLTASGPREAWVVATNVYHKTAQGWRLVAHHASPGSPHEALAGSEGPAVLH